MGLDFGESLFPQQGLLQEEGLLKERWNQEGSSVTTVYGDCNSDHVIYTVTAGKTFYAKHLVFSGHDADAGTFELKDTAAGDTQVHLKDTATAGNTVSINFDSPLVFGTEVYCLEGTAANISITLTGWEEKG